MQLEAQSHQGNRIQYPSDVRTGAENGPKSRWYVCEVMTDTLLYGTAPLLTACATIAIAMAPAFYRVNIPYKQTRCIWAALVTESESQFHRQSQGIMLNGGDECQRSAV
jgi:hypothetical protein